MTMRITKFSHSCVRLSYGDGPGRDVVVDPGALVRARVARRGRPRC